MSLNGTIAAVSTPYGRGGIAVIRISGDDAVKYAEKVFFPRSGKKLSEYPAAKEIYGSIVCDGEIIDDGLAAVFRAPHSFTGEDTVEISCHGGIALTREVLSAAFTAGCVPAEAGEFTKRAFVNGKISLSQAEAVIGLIDAGSRESIRLTAAQGRGALSKRIDSVRNGITDILASVYAYIDYPDEDLTDMTPAELLERTQKIKTELISLVSSYRTGRAVCEGILTVIAGKPNTGKSSILNRIIGRERAIVTNVPGTTRDTVEETVSVGKITLRICDTAGIRESDDEVEKIGIKRAEKLISEAELILAVFDGSEEPDGYDAELIGFLKKCGGQIIPIINKSDVMSVKNVSEIETLGEISYISAANGEGFEKLYERINGLYISEAIDYDTEPVISNARQHAAAAKALENVNKAICSLENGMTQDIAGMDLEAALSSLGEIDGRTAAAEVTDRIFSRFCVGK